MKRYTYPKFKDCSPPAKTIKLADNTYKLPIDMKKALHHTYIDIHGRPPKRGTNPIFDEYEQLLDSSDELRFQSPGIADDTESRIGESRKLGRGIARYILSEYYGYTWFGKIQSLIESPYQDWTIERPIDGGDTPDWLISDGGKNFCIGEAKGTHSHISTTSELTEKWRKQCTNIIVKKNGRKRKLKSWLIATRFVNESNPSRPEQLIEDPYTEGDEINENDYSSLNQFIQRDHISKSLFRISNYKLGIKILNKSSIEKDRIEVMTWKPLIKEISHLEFIGKPIYPSEGSGFSWNWRHFFHFKTQQEIWEEYADFMEAIDGEMMFDGIAVDVIKNYSNSYGYGLAIEENLLNNYPFISLLKDGNIIVPMSLMRPHKLITI